MLEVMKIGARAFFIFFAFIFFVSTKHYSSSLQKQELKNGAQTSWRNSFLVLPIVLHFLEPFSYSLSSLAILEAMFLKAMEVPDMRLKRTPLRDRRGSLQTSISHWTRLSCRASP